MSNEGTRYSPGGLKIPWMVLPSVLRECQVNAFLNWNPRQSKNNYLVETQTYKILGRVRCYPLTERVNNYLSHFPSGVAGHHSRKHRGRSQEGIQPGKSWAPLPDELGPSWLHAVETVSTNLLGTGEVKTGQLLEKYERCRRNSPRFILSSQNQINILATLMPIDSLPLWHVYRMSSSCSAGCVQGNAPAEHWRRGSQFSRSQGRATGVTRPTEHIVSSREWKILLWEKEDWKESSHLI